MLKIKVRQMWWFLFLAIASYPMAVYASVELEQVVLVAPFLSSWLGIWVFAMAGGVASAFIRVEEIDRKLFVPFISKPFIGTVFGVGLCMFMSDGVDPPKGALTFWALIVSTCSTPVVAGFLVFISDQKRQNKVYKDLQEKYLPFSKKEVSDDDSNQH